MTMNDPYIPEDPFDPAAGMPYGAGVAPEDMEVPEEYRAPVGFRSGFVSFVGRPNTCLLYTSDAADE